MLIAVEGIDGCGKTTLVARLAAELRARGRTVVVVRRYMLDEITALWWRLLDLDLIDQRGTAQLAAADYATGLQRIINPALHAGSVVIADKYAYSHRVYFTLRGMPSDELDVLFRDVREADHVLWPRMDAPAALERLRRTDGKPDLLECGLDHRLGLSIGAAFARYGLGGAPAPLREQHFLEHHARTDELFAALLPPTRTHELDAQLDRDALASAALDAIDAERDPRAGAATARELVDG